MSDKDKYSHSSAIDSTDNVVNPSQAFNLADLKEAMQLSVAAKEKTSQSETRIMELSPELLGELNKNEKIENERKAAEWFGDLAGDIQSSAQGYLDMSTLGTYTMAGLPKPIDILRYMGQAKADMGAVGYRKIEQEDRVDLEIFGKSLNELLPFSGEAPTTLEGMKGFFDADRREQKTNIGKVTDAIGFVRGFRNPIATSQTTRTAALHGAQKMTGAQQTTTIATKSRMMKDLKIIAEKHGVKGLQGFNITNKTALRMFMHHANQRIIQPIKQFGNPSVFKSGKVLDKFQKTHYDEAAKLLEETLLASGIKIGKVIKKADGTFYNPAIDDIFKLVNKEFTKLGGRPVTSLVDMIAKYTGDTKLASAAVKLWDEAANFALANAILHTSQVIGHELGTKGKPTETYGSTMKHGLQLGATLGLIKFIPGGAKSGMQINPFSAEGRRNLSMLLGNMPKRIRRYKVTGKSELAQNGRDAIWSMFNYYSKSKNPGTKGIISGVFNKNSNLVKMGGIKGGSSLGSITRALSDARIAGNLKAEEAIAKLLQKSLQAIGKDVAKTWRPQLLKLIKDDISPFGTGIGTWARMILGGAALSGGFAQLSSDFVSTEDKVINFLVGAFLLKKPHSFAYRGDGKRTFYLKAKETDNWHLRNGWKEGYGQRETDLKEQREFVEALGYEPNSEYFHTRMQKHKFDEPYLDIARRLTYSDRNPEYIKARDFFFSKDDKGNYLYLKPIDTAEGLVMESFPEGKDSGDLAKYDAHKSMLENNTFLKNTEMRMIGKGEFTREAWQGYQKYLLDNGLGNVNDVLMQVATMTKQNLNKTLKQDLIDGGMHLSLSLEDSKGNKVFKWEEIIDQESGNKVYKVRKIEYHENLEPEKRVLLDEYNEMIGMLSSVYPARIIWSDTPARISNTTRGKETFFKGMEELKNSVNESLNFKETDNVEIEFGNPYLHQELHYHKVSQDIPLIAEFMRDIQQYQEGQLGEKGEEIGKVQTMLNDMFTDGSKKMVTEISKESLKDIPKRYHNVIRDMYEIFKTQGDFGVTKNKYIYGNDSYVKPILLKDAQDLYSILASRDWVHHFKGKTQDPNLDTLANNIVVEEVINKVIKGDIMSSYVGKPTSEKTPNGEPIYTIQPYGTKEYQQDEVLRNMGLIEPGSKTLIRPISILKEVADRMDNINEANWNMVIKEAGNTSNDTRMLEMLIKAAQEYNADIMPSDLLKTLIKTMPESQKTVKYRDSVDGKIKSKVINHLQDSKNTSFILTEQKAKQIILSLDALELGVYGRRQVNFQQSFHNNFVMKEIKGLSRIKKKLISSFIQSNINNEGVALQYQLEAMGYVSKETGRFLTPKIEKNLPKFIEDINRMVKGLDIKFNDNVDKLVSGKENMEDLEQETPNVEKSDDIARTLNDLTMKYKFDGNWKPMEGKDGGHRMDLPQQFESRIKSRLNIGSKIEDVANEIVDNIKKNNEGVSDETLAVEGARIINNWGTGTAVTRIKFDLNARPHIREVLMGVKNDWLENYMELTNVGSPQHRLIFIESTVVGLGRGNIISLNDPGVFNKVATAMQTEGGMSNLALKADKTKSIEGEIEGGKGKGIYKDDIGEYLLNGQYIAYRPDKAEYIMGIPMEPLVLNKIVTEYVKYRSKHDLPISYDTLGITEVDLVSGKKEYTYEVHGDPLQNVRRMFSMMNDILMSKTWGHEIWNEGKLKENIDFPEFVKRLKLGRNRTALKQSKKRDLEIANFLENSKLKGDEKFEEIKQNLIKTARGNFRTVVVDDEQIIKKTGKRDQQNKINKLFSVIGSRERTSKDEFGDDLLEKDRSELTEIEKEVIDALGKGREETWANSYTGVNPDMVQFVAFKMGIPPSQLNKLGGLKYIMFRKDAAGNAEPVKTAGGYTKEFFEYFQPQEGKKGPRDPIGFIEFTSGNKPMLGKYRERLKNKVFHIENLDDLLNVPNAKSIPFKPEEMSLISAKGEKPTKLPANFTAYFRNNEALQKFNEYNITRKQFDIHRDMRNNLGSMSTSRGRRAQFQSLIEQKFADRGGELDFFSTNQGVMYNLSQTKFGIDPYYNIDTYIDLLHNSTQEKLREVDNGYEAVLIPDSNISKETGELINTIKGKKGIITYGEMRESWMNGEQIIDPKNFFIIIRNHRGIDEAIHVKAIPDYIKRMEETLLPNEKLAKHFIKDLEFLTDFEAIRSLTRAELHDLITGIKSDNNRSVQLGALLFRNPIVGPNSVLIEGVKGFTNSDEVASNVHIINKADIVRELEADHDIDTGLTVNAQPREVFNHFRDIREFGTDSEELDMTLPSYEGTSFKDYEALNRFVEDAHQSDYLKAIPMTLPRLLQFARFYNNQTGFEIAGKSIKGVLIHSGKDRFITLKQGSWDTDSLLKSLNQHFLDAEGKGFDKTMYTKDAIWEKVLFGKESPFVIRNVVEVKRIEGKEEKTKIQLEKIEGDEFTPVDKFLIKEYLKVYERFLSGIKYDWASGKMKEARVKNIIESLENYSGELETLENDILQSMPYGMRKEYLTLRKSYGDDRATLYNGTNMNANIGHFAKQRQGDLNNNNMLPAELEALNVYSLYAKKIEVSNEDYKGQFRVQALESKLLNTTKSVSESVNELANTLKTDIEYNNQIKDIKKRKNHYIERLMNEYNVHPDTYAKKHRAIEKLKGIDNIEQPKHLIQKIRRLDDAIDILQKKLNENYEYKWDKKAKKWVEGKWLKEHKSKIIKDKINRIRTEEKAKYKKDKFFQLSNNKELREKAIKELEVDGGIKINTVVDKYGRISNKYIMARAGFLTWGEIYKYDLETITNKPDINAVDKSVEDFMRNFSKIVDSVFDGKGIIAKEDWKAYDKAVQVEIQLIMNKANRNPQIENIVMAKLASAVTRPNEYDIFRGELMPSIKDSYYAMRLNAVMRWNNTTRMEYNPRNAKEFNERFSANLNESVEFLIGNGTNVFTRNIERRIVPDVWSMSALFKGTDYSKEAFLGEINPLTRALYGRDWSRLGTWQKIQFYYGIGIHEMLVKNEGFVGRVTGAYDANQRYNMSINTIKDVEKAMENELGMFYSREIAPNDFTEIIFNRGNYMPLGREGKSGFKSDVVSWTRNAVRNACKLKFPK